MTTSLSDTLPIKKTAASSALAGIGWMFLAQILFSAMSIFTRLGARHVPWPETGLSRFFFGTLVAYLLARTRGSTLRVTNKKWTWARAVCGTFSALAVFYTLSSPKIPLGDAVTLGSLGPVFVVLLSWPILKERVGKLVLYMAPLSFLGVILVVKPSFHSAAVLALIAMGGSFFYSIAMISLRRVGPNESGPAVVFHFSVFGTAVMLALSIPTWVTPDLLSGFYLTMTGLTGGLAQLAMTRAYSLDRAARISSLNYMGIIVTNLFAIPVFGTIPGTWQIVGSILVITSGLAVTLGARMESPAEAEQQ